MRHATMAAPIGACLMVALAGCTADGTNGAAASSAPPQQTPSSTGAPPATGSGAAPTCVVGNWKSTSTTASGGAGGATVTLKGGTGSTLRIGPDGRTQADFTGMQPLTFTATALGKNITGQFTYSGTITGTVRFPAAGGPSGSGPNSSGPNSSGPNSSSPNSSGPSGAGSSPAGGPSSSSGSGAWEPVGPLDWGGLTVTAKLTEPVAITVLDNVRVSDLTGERQTQLGNAVDVQPIFRKGIYTCGGDTLTIVPQESGPTITWVFKRA